MRQGQRRRKAPISAETVDAVQSTFVAIVFTGMFGSLFYMNGLFTVHAIQTVAAQFANPVVMPTDGPSRQFVQWAIWLLDWRVAWAISIVISLFEVWGWKTFFRPIQGVSAVFMVIDLGTTIYGLHLIAASQGVDYALPLGALYIGIMVVTAVMMGLGPEYAFVEMLSFVGLIEVPERPWTRKRLEKARAQSQREVRGNKEQARREGKRRKRTAKERAAERRRGAWYDPDDDDDEDDEDDEP
jgi:hypothetical protein